ncbi:serine carboxypeptidase II-3-like [Diospyros lotus]|uniref:serine carboxypeptidase II-3-like n=1 Tax=Diospyros lotus TaxID=55363 RepID=UPI00225328D2|nr:serine carboxypeptidase II-3-like [Diospyros lotus]
MHAISPWAVSTAVVNLRGIAMGNPNIDFETTYTGIFDFFWSHALISDEIHERIVSNSNFSSQGSVSDTCNDYVSEAFEAKANVFFFDIYIPLCSPLASNSPLLSSFHPCSGYYIILYLNIPEVQKYLHANVTGLPGPWDSCSSYIISHWNDMPLTVLPPIQKLMNSGISAWIYRLVGTLLGTIIWCS